MAENTTATVDFLLQRSRWIEELARSLVADEHAAQDLVQDTWLVALRAGPDDGKPLARWFAAVMRNLARARLRTNRRREAREREGSRPERQSGDAALLEQLEVHRRLVEAVGELAEPYRTAVLQRYFEGLDPAEIARRTRTPVRTIHTRLHRALELLRERLDREHRGDRRAWMLALTPLVREPNLVPIGALLVDAKLKIAAVVVACGAVGTWYALQARSGQASSPRAAEQTELAGPAPTRANAPEPGRADETRVERAEVAVASEAAREPEASVPLPRLHGIVIDADNAPLSGVRVVFADAAAPSVPVNATSDAHGEFELAARGSNGSIDCDDPRYVGLLCPEVRTPDPRRQYVLVVAPRLSLAGTVVDDAGAPIEAAWVGVQTWSLRYRIERVLDDSSDVECSTRSDANGRFELPRAPRLASARLVATHEGHRASVQTVPSADQRDFEIVLARETDAEHLLRGFVVGPDGEPIAGAWVAAGRGAENSDEKGVFTLDLSFESDTVERHVRALKPGFLPSTVDCLRDPPTDPRSWPQPLIVVLREPALSIRGQVVDADGAPVAHCAIERLDGNEFGLVTEELGGGSIRFRADTEQLLRKDSFAAEVTDDYGRFEIDGLLAQRYSFRFFDPRSLAHVDCAPIAAGASEVEIRLPRVRRVARIAGRVVDSNGAPMPGASVATRCMLPPVERGSRDLPPMPHPGASTLTDAEGRFEFRDVPELVDGLVAKSSQSAQEVGLPLKAGADWEALEIVLARSTHLKVDLEGSDVQADAFSVLGPEGNELMLAAALGTRQVLMRKQLIVSGKSQTLQVPDNARELVLFRNDAEVARLPLKLKPDMLNLIRP